MKEQRHSPLGVCPAASPKGETVSIYVDRNHPLLQLQRALPWEAIFAVMTRHWRQAGKNVDGRPGLGWDVSLYGPLVVLMLVKNLNSRAMEAYVALGKAGVEEVNALVLHVAKDYGFADPQTLSSDTTAQELPIGYPNEPGILRGLAQRCGRALHKLKRLGV